ncbi:MAG: hypothetical protein JW867_09190 [Candidatus Omnitrophica bacterium]|nr:hypothetical protein [Candidatus Omnitrophota bacterium]
MEASFSDFIFENTGGTKIDKARAGTSIRIKARDLTGYPRPKVLFYGKRCHTYAEIIQVDPGGVVFRVPKLDNPGWYKVKVQTRSGWSNEQTFFCC